MKNIIIAIATITCLIINSNTTSYGQNHRISPVPTLRETFTETSLFISKDGDMYQQTRFLSRYSNGDIVQNSPRKDSFLYHIPQHIQEWYGLPESYYYSFDEWGDSRLATQIDGIMKGDTVKKYKWSWFVVWELQCMKDSSTKMIVKEMFITSLLTLPIIALAIFSISIILRKGKINVVSLIYDDDKEFIWFGFLMGSVINGVFGGMYLGLKYHLDPFPSVLIMGLYGCIVVAFIQLLARIYSFLTKTKTKNSEM